MVSTPGSLLYDPVIEFSTDLSDNPRGNMIWDCTFLKEPPPLPLSPSPIISSHSPKPCQGHSPPCSLPSFVAIGAQTLVLEGSEPMGVDPPWALPVGGRIITYTLTRPMPVTQIYLVCRRNCGNEDILFLEEWERGGGRGWSRGREGQGAWVTKALRDSSDSSLSLSAAALWNKQTSQKGTGQAGCTSAPAHAEAWGAQSQKEVWGPLFKVSPEVSVLI